MERGQYHPTQKNRLTTRTKIEQCLGLSSVGKVMTVDPESQPASESDRLETATEQAIAACGGDARDAVKALIVANDFLEALVEELRADVSKGYARGYYHGRFKTYTG
jgi:hypothetical protein